MNTQTNEPELLPFSSPELASIKLLCCDVDGVMTDGGIYFNEHGHCLIKFSVLDGIGLKRVKELGIKTAFISMTNSPIIQKRANILGIDFCRTGVVDKEVELQLILQTLGLELNQVCHIADDVNDLSLFAKVSVPVTVPNGVDEMKRAARFVTKRAGGYGAVRELCDALANSINSSTHSHL